jgi:hypothetical protein
LCGEKLKTIAKDYAISEETACRISKGKRWKGAALQAVRILAANALQAQGHWPTQGWLAGERMRLRPQRDK